MNVHKNPGQFLLSNHREHIYWRDTGVVWQPDCTRPQTTEEDSKNGFIYHRNTIAIDLGHLHLSMQKEGIMEGHQPPST